MYLNKNNPSALPKVVASLKNSSMDVFNYHEAMDDLDSTCLPRFNKRIFAEAIYLNSLYLDWFNGTRDVESFCLSFDINVVDFYDFKVYIRSIHNTLHEGQ
jgi:hypothetical protein